MAVLHLPLWSHFKVQRSLYGPAEPHFCLGDFLSATVPSTAEVQSPREPVLPVRL